MLGYIIFTCFAVGCLAQGFPGEGPCAGREYGDLIPDPTDCSWYYNCQSANTTRMPCPAGLHFSAVIKNCVFPLQANCTVGSTITPTVSTSTAPTTVPTLPCLTCATHETATMSSSTTGLPSIEAPCTSLDPETIGDPDDCSKYTYCYMGKPAIVKCAIGEFYSKPHNACIESAECPGDGETVGTTTPQVPVVIPPCSSLNAETIGFAHDCTKYTYCYNGIPHIVKCAIGEFYSAPHKACIEAPECPASGITTTTTESSTVIIPPCDSLDYSTKEDPSDCTRYYFCENGVPHLIYCYPGTYYSKDHNGCIIASECPAGNGGPVTPAPSTPKPTEAPIQAPCTSRETETLEYPGDCKRYYYCEQGHPFIVKCALGQYYSKADNACIEADECPAQATPPTTTPLTTTPSTTTPSTTTPSTTTPSTTTPSTTTPSTTTPSTTTPSTTTPSTTTPSTTTPSTTTPSTTTPSTTTPSTTTPSTTTPSTTTPSTTTSTTTENPIKPPCTSMEDQTFPIPEDCTRYIYCYMGSPLTAQCEKDYYFSVANKSCIAADECPQKN